LSCTEVDVLKEATHKAVGVIRRNDNHFLIAKRPQGKPYEGYWEFPGGKVEPGEQVQDALVRELYEEIGIRVLKSVSLIQVYHESPENPVLLDVYLVEHFEGDAQGMEGQHVKWVMPQEFSLYEFPPASPLILEVVVKMFLKV
jgi:8-oxo-dGTP diphosphatase